MCLPISLHCSTTPSSFYPGPVGAVGPPRAETNNCAKVDFEPTPNTQEAPATTVQNLTSRISKLEKLFADEIATYTSITAGIHSQYFFLYDKIRQLEPGNSDVINWKISSVKFVIDSAKVARPSSDPLVEPATSFSSPISGLTVLDTTYQILPYGVGPATGKCASTIRPLPWRLRQSSPMALLKAHSHWYPRSTRPTEHLDEDNST